MDIPPSVLEGLQNLDKVEDSIFGALVDGVYDTLAGRLTTEELIMKEPVHAIEDELKSSLINCLMLFIVEVCRSNLGSGGIKELLEDAGMPNNRVSRLLTSHKVKHKSIKAELSRIRPSFSSILDVKWTLEYVRGRNAGAQYQVTLITDREPITFTCTPPQLNDLVTQLQSGCYSLDNLLTQ